jgi:hypothetical protein
MRLIQVLELPFWERFDFWIFLLLSIASIVLTVLSFLQAKKAKEAALSATKTVKLQTITIELTEIIQKLDRLSATIEFTAARDLLNETSRKVRRLISPFRNDLDYKEVINSIYAQLDNATDALVKVRPTGEEVVPYAVYNAVENYFTKLNGTLSDLLGLIEKRTINLQ